ncbi:MAG: GlsB/YeaQ/YmgE family stress response membrane protein [Microbacteriaceae bacterium]
MGILAWIVLGLIAGAIAKLILPGKQPGGIIITIIIGIVGALLGGWIGSLLFNTDVNDFSLSSILLAIGGAIIVLLVYGALAGRRNRS